MGVQGESLMEAWERDKEEGGKKRTANFALDQCCQDDSHRTHS